MNKVIRYNQDKLISFSDPVNDPNPEYTYIFVRQDQSKEQQLVQAAHVALVLGTKLKKDVSNLYFSVIGIPTLKDFCKVMKDLKEHGTKYEVFYEPDVGNTMTAIASYPIRKDKRGKLLNYKRLRFE